MIDPDTVPIAWMDTNGVVEMNTEDYAKLIPPEVVEAAAIAGYERSTAKPWGTAGYINQQNWRRAARAALAAGLAAWPDMTYAKWRDYGQADRLVLPLPQEGAE